MDVRKFRIVAFYERTSDGIDHVEQWDEPIEAVEAAEQWLQTYGVAQKSHAEIRFNGDAEPHFLLFHLGEGRTGIFNTDACKWPVYYMPTSAQFRDQLLEIPWEVPNDGSQGTETTEEWTPDTTEEVVEPDPVEDTDGGE